MAFWEQEWKTHYDPVERTYNIPEEKIWELLEENKKLTEQLEEKEKEVSLINSEEMENEEEIAKLKKLVDEYKDSSLREKEATPQEITDYMKELSSELVTANSRYEELSMWEDEIYDALDMSDLCSSRDDVLECITDHYSFYDPTHMDELRDHFRTIYNNIKDDEWQVYADEGFDPEAKHHELKEGYTHTSLKKMQYIFETTWSNY